MDGRLPTPRPASALSADELAAVVRRASELDAVVPAHTSDLDEQEAREVLREAGLSEAAAEQALAEWRRGELPVAPPPPVEAPRRLSPVVVVERPMPLEPPALRQALEAQLRRQWFTRGRAYGPTTTEWLPRSGLVADLRRRLDVRGTLLLHEVSRLRLEVVPAGVPGQPDACRVRLTADLGGLRSRLVGSMVGLPAGLGAAVSLAGIPTSTPELIASGLPIGLAVAGGGYLSAARTLERRKARIEESLHILLDRLTPYR